MSYPISPPSNLRCVAAGRTFAVGITDVGIGSMFGVFELIGGGWSAIWYTEPLLTGDFQAALDKVGGVQKWLEMVAKTVNEKLRAMLAGVSAPVAGESYHSQIEAELTRNWRLVVGADGVPVFERKA